MTTVDIHALPALDRLLILIVIYLLALLLTRFAMWLSDVKYRNTYNENSREPGCVRSAFLYGVSALLTLPFWLTLFQRN